jgi:hypothetical protein
VPFFISSTSCARQRQIEAIINIKTRFIPDQPPFQRWMAPPESLGAADRRARSGGSSRFPLPQIRKFWLGEELAVGPARWQNPGSFQTPRLLRA